MAAAVPIIGSVIAGIVVSKAVSAIGPKLGLSDEMTGIAATVAGVYAGGMTYNAASTPATSGITGNQVGMDLSVPEVALPSAGGDLSMAGSSAAPSGAAAGAGHGVPSGPGPHGRAATPAPSGSVAPSALTAPPSELTPEVASPLKISSAPDAQPQGMLSQSQPATPPTSNTATNTVESSTTGAPPPPNADATWYEKLFSSEKTLDLLMAGMQGYGEAAMAKEDREYDEHIARENAKGWVATNPSPGGFLTISNQYPSNQ